MKQTLSKVKNLEKFNEGKMGDDMNFIEWSSIYQMHNRLIEKNIELEGKK